MSDRIRSLFLIAILLPALALAAAGPSEGPYAARRTALIAKVGAGIILIPSQIQGPRGGAVQDNKDFIYLTGAAEPDALIEELKNDEAIATADTLLLTVPNQLGVDYNAHAIESILRYVAPDLGWR